MADDRDDAFREKLRSVDASMAIAQQYLDRSAHHYPEHLTLPMAAWRETLGPLSIAPPGEPRCGNRAVQGMDISIPYGPSLILRNPISCIRPPGHDGHHAIRSEAYGRHKAKWRALSWD